MSASISGWLINRVICSHTMHYNVNIKVQFPCRGTKLLSSIITLTYTLASTLMQYFLHNYCIIVYCSFSLLLLLCYLLKWLFFYLIWSIFFNSFFNTISLKSHWKVWSAILNLNCFFTIALINCKTIFYGAWVVLT